MPARPAAACAVLGFVSLLLGWTLGGLAQPAAYSSVRDDTSDLGAMTAESPWLYNQIGQNLTGLLVIAFALGLWRALSPDLLGRLGTLALLVTGVSVFLDGFFRLDCRGIDSGCDNESWHAQAHKIESGITAGASLAAIMILALAFRRNARWRDAWLPMLAFVPALFVASAAFSAWGDGAAQRAGTIVIFLSLIYAAVCLVRKAASPAAEPAAPSA